MSDNSPAKNKCTKGKRLEYNRKWISQKRQKKQQYLDTYISDEEYENRPEKSNYQGLNIDRYKKNERRDMSFSKFDVIVPNTENVENQSNLCDKINSHDANEQWDLSDLEIESDLEFASLIEDLRDWAGQFEIKHCALDSLLKILKSNGHDHELPSSARKLLETPRLIEIDTVSGSNYYHFDTKNMMKNILEKMPDDDVNNLENIILSLNIDGLPLFKSSNTSVWPVLASIDNLKTKKVFPISFSVGTGKPSDLNFLNDAVNDLNEICRNGFQFCEKTLPVCISCIICDAPAKAFVKNVKLFSGYYGCDRCDQSGVYIGRMTYQEVENINERTDRSFRTREQDDHHKGQSPLENLPIDMIAQVPIDYMHQVCLGVMKRLLLIWMRGPKLEYRPSVAQISHISEKLVGLRKYVPNDFVRKPRPLNEVDRWKATEFRQFLLYTGQFALKGILPNLYYDHFMTLNTAISILVSEHLTSLYAEYAHNLLVHFVKSGKELYGQEFMVYNVHSLVHLKNDACKFGCLENCAAWKYENYMKHLKRKVRNGNQPAVQLVKRVYEEMALANKTVVQNRQQNKLNFKQPNNAFTTSTGRYCEVLYANNETSFMCRLYTNSNSQFTVPCDSRTIGVTKFKNNNYEMKCLTYEEIKTKCMLIKQDNYLVFLPLLHDV